MPTRFIAKLENFTRLSGVDRDALHGIIEKRHRTDHRIDLVTEGQIPGSITLILDGWACRYRQLEDGRRQITSIMLPGDICYLNGTLISKMDHSIGTLTPVEYATICRKSFGRLISVHSRVQKALAWEMEVTASIQRAWLVNIGQREGPGRIGHLLCEIFDRLSSVGLVDGNSCEMPLRQIDLADATGLTNIHVNRCLQQLRGNGFIALKNRRLVMEDRQSLWSVSSFNPNYLHLNKMGAYIDANDNVELFV